jgi:hypothetical protein
MLIARDAGGYLKRVQDDQTIDAGPREGLKQAKMYDNREGRALKLQYTLRGRNDRGSDVRRTGTPGVIGRPIQALRAWRLGFQNMIYRRLWHSRSFKRGGGRPLSDEAN